eukprot:CAMPEP_0117893954 /NCGR_PEP_ID=MMETSP0950-20121206/25643_1 /TAXON_ID=44440 /ORGANISM="Chattonella subsalsa, Strain CCMP2191" /LENGTH=335 /DNA_ID=CAMNT_0005754331 /DNA_START=164 /DNA_END=1170 /DNA_ORIENTATION=+
MDKPNKRKQTNESPSSPKAKMNAKQNKYRGKRRSKWCEWLAQESQRMEEKVGWPYARYPTYGWLFRKQQNVHGKYHSLLEDGYCIIQLSGGELEQLQLLVQIAEKQPKQFLQVQKKQDEVGIFDNTKSAAKKHSRRYSMKWKAGDYGDDQLDNTPMTKLIKAWVRDTVLMKIINFDLTDYRITFPFNFNLTDYRITFPQIIGYRGYETGPDAVQNGSRDNLDQLPHRDCKQDRALYNFSCIINLMPEDAILRIAKGVMLHSGTAYKADHKRFFTFLEIYPKGMDACVQTPSESETSHYDNPEDEKKLDRTSRYCFRVGKQYPELAQPLKGGIWHL